MNPRIFTGGVIMGKLIRICLLCLSILILMTGCSKKQNKDVEGTVKTRTEKITFKNRSDNKMVDKEVPILSHSKEDIVREIFSILQEGIEDPDVVATIPKNIELLNVTFEGSKLKLNFSEEYNKMEASEETISRTSLLSSLFNHSFIESITFTINDVLLKGADGKPMGPFTKDSLIIDDSESEQKRTKKVMLYFANEEGRLVPYETEIEINPNEPFEKTVLKLLIAGPQDENLVRTIPEGTKIISISISEGICYIDLSSDFVNKHQGGSTGEKLTVYSIVNTLTELPDISKVQFLIEGEKQSVFKGNLSFDQLFDRKLDMIVNE